MKSILMSIKPQYVAKILNGEKTIEIRKKFPKKYVGWVYIYVTKGLPHLAKTYANDYEIYDETQWDKDFLDLNGKVIARFWCDKVEDFEFCEFSKYKDNLELYNECVRKDNELCKKACIGCVQMVQYLDTKAIGKDMFGKAIHITNLEIFDKPKDISEFMIHNIKKEHVFNNFRLTRAPQSWCYIEV